MTEDEEARQAAADERVLERIEAQILASYQQSCDADYLTDYAEGELSMTDTVTPDREAELRDQIARLNRKIDEVKYEITRWQDELSDLEVERVDLFEKPDEVEDAEAIHDAR